MSVEKRKHSALSSLSDLETSGSDISTSSTPEKVKEKNAPRQKTKKTRIEQDENKKEIESEKIPNKMAPKKNVEEELKKINEKLGKVITKEDNGFLKQFVKDIVQEMKESLLSSFTRQLEVIQGELHEKSIENDKLKQEVKDMRKIIDMKAEEIKRLERKNEYDRQTNREDSNDQEQCSRRNNIRISNMPNDNPKQTSQETTSQVVIFLNTKLGVDLSETDIDISHRLGQFKQDGRPRQVIVKFVRRQKKVDVMTQRKKLKGTNIYIFEDLTKLNNEIFACTRKKQPDEVERSWSVEGKIFVKWKLDSTVQKLKFSDYQKWIELPWPASNSRRRD